MKRNIIIGVCIILAILALVFYLSKTENSFFKETSLYTAVPVSIPVFVEFNSLKSIPFNDPLAEKWVDVDKINRFNLWIGQLDSIIQENGDIQNGLRTDRFIVALGIMGDKSLVPLIIQKAESSGRQKSIEKLARALFPEPEFTYSEIDYTGYKITSETTFDHKKSIHYCFTSGLLIASQNLVLVQQSLLQLSEKGITGNPSFDKLTKSMESEPYIAFYFNQRLFPDFLLEYTNSSSIAEMNEFGSEVKRNHYRNLQGFKRFAAWSELDAKFNGNDILLNGFTVASDSANHFLSVFNGQEAQRSNAGNILPKNTSYFTSFSFSNKKLFFDRLEKYFSLAGSFYKREDLIGKMETDLRIEFKKSFQSMVKSEMIVAVTNIPAEKADKTTYFIFDVNGKSKAENLLDSMLLNNAKRNGKQLNDLKSVFSLNDKKEFTIIEFPFPSFPGIWIGKPFYTAQAKYAVFYKDFLVFCNTANGLQNYLTDMESDNVLDNDKRFKRINSISVSKSNIGSYVNVSRSLNLTSELLSAELIKKLEKKNNILRKIHAIGWQVSGGNEVYQNEISIVFDDGKPEDEESSGKTGTGVSSQVLGDSQTAWQCNLGNQLIIKPVFTINHTDKDDKKIYAYDKQGKLMSGWNFEGTKSEVNTPLQFFRITGKDYIVFKDKYQVYIRNRKGEAAAKPAAEFKNSRNLLYLISAEKPKLVTTDSKGGIYYIDFDGNYEKKKVGRFDDDHFFIADDLNGDKMPEFIFVDGKELTVLDENGTVLFTQKFANTIQNQPNIYRFGPKQKKIGIVDAKANQICLFDAKGQQYPGFPLQGATEFSIGKTTQSSQKLNLIVGSKGGNLYNYVLD